MGRMITHIGMIAVALALMGASPPEDQRGKEQSNTQQPHGQASAPATMPQKPNPDPLNAACKVGDDNRSSDLCAQWKAADAAAQGAKAADRSALWAQLTGIFTFVGLIVGAVTMGAAIAAAMFAREAAEHTEAGAKAASEAVDVSRITLAAAQRAWVSIECHIEGTWQSGATHSGPGYFLSIRGQSKNCGNEPAVDLRFHAHIGINGVESATAPGLLDPMAASPEKLQAFSDRWINAPGGEVVFPGEPSRLGHEVFLSQDEINRAVALFPNTENREFFSPYLIVSCIYKTAQLEGARHTSIMYHLFRHRQVDGRSDAAMFEVVPDWWASQHPLMDTFHQVAT